MFPMDIQELNCLTPELYEIPKYVPNPEHRFIKVYYAEKEQEVIIVGVADNNFIYWLSVTKMDDVETNEKILDYITTTEPTIFGSESHVIDKTKYNYEKLRRMYWAEIKYAGNIMYHYKEMKELCRIREANGKYLEIMRYYANLLQTRTGSLSADCDRNRGVYQLLKNERYLLLSENGNVRKMYRQLEKMWSKMYNAYMTEAR